MNILGVNLAKRISGELVYDGSASLLTKSLELSAIGEERLNRRKYSGGYSHSVKEILCRAKIKMDEIDLVVTSCYGEESILEKFGSLGFDSAKNVCMIPSHHLSHAYSAFFPSEFDEALILVADNEGSILGKKKYSDTWKNALERVSVYYANRQQIDLLEHDMETENVVSLGEIYSSLTHFLGFESYQNAGKTMALAAYGNAEKFDEVSFIECLPNGKIRCNLKNNYINTNAELEDFLFKHKFNLRHLDNGEEICQIYKDLAACIQKQLERALIHKLAYWIKSTGVNKVCFAGGIALNCVAVYRIAKELKLTSIFVPTNPGDQGLAIGNVLYGWYNLCKQKEKIAVQNAYLGFEYTQEQCFKILELYKDRLEWSISGNICAILAQDLVDGKVIALFQGKSEWGPRALGNRSILADPRKNEMKDYINNHIKHREMFRPFAPVVTVDKAKDYFECDFATPFMTVAVPLKKNMRSIIPAIAHIDDTARVQIVDSQNNSFLFNLIKEFGKLTGVEVLLNTSFNDNSEPIVESPTDAIECFLKIGKIDILVLESIIIRHKSVKN